MLTLEINGERESTGNQLIQVNLVKVIKMVHMCVKCLVFIFTYSEHHTITYSVTQKGTTNVQIRKVNGLHLV